MAMLGLDTATPPDALQWMNDLHTARARAAFYYAWPDYGYTPAHVGMAKAYGFKTSAIIRSGDNPEVSINAFLNAVAALGGVGDSVTFILEKGSMPPPSWLGVWIAEARKQSYPPRRYGLPEILDGYPWAGGNWLSGAKQKELWPMAGLPVGYLAWQYAIDVVINGSQYNASVVDPKFFG